MEPMRAMEPALGGYMEPMRAMERNNQHSIGKIKSNIIDINIMLYTE